MAEVRVARPDEHERVAELAASMYRPEARAAVQARLLEGLRSGDFRRAELCGVYVVDDEIVGTLLAMQVDLCFGLAPVPTAGLDHLVLEPSHWGREGVQRLLDVGREVIQAAGCDLVLGFGIMADYYDRWGVTPVMARYDAMLEVKRVKGTPLRPFRPATPDDDALLTELYANANRGRTGTVVATPGMWRGSVRRPDHTLVRDDAFFGFYAEPEELYVTEAAAPSLAACRDLLLAMCTEARARKVAKLHLELPTDHPLIRCAVPYGIDLQERYHPTGYWMARILDVPRFFGRLRDELERRLRAAAGPRLALRLVTAEDHVALDLDGGGSSTLDLELRLTVRDLTQLAFGYREPLDLLDERGLTLAPEAARVVQALFPREHAFVWPAPW